MKTIRTFRVLIEEQLGDWFSIRLYGVWIISGWAIALGFVGI